jgi:biotin carboxyl carrier protein
MTFDEIASLIARLMIAQISECEYETHGLKLRVLFDRARAVPSSESVQSTSIRVPLRRGKPSNVYVIPSGEMGIFHSKHPLAQKVGAREGEVVSQGQILAYLRTGTVLRPVIAPLKGRITKELILDGAVVGYGDPLYLFEVAGV